MQVRGGTDFNKGKRNELAILQVMDRAYCIIRRVSQWHACAILFLVSDGGGHGVLWIIYTFTAY
jgi:hypothetical protein